MIPLPHKEDSRVLGELNYLKNISNPSNASIGVCVEIVLSNPTSSPLNRAKLTVYGYNVRLAIFRFNETHNGAPVEDNGYFLEFHDINHDAHLSSHNRIHFYGQNMTGKGLEITITGYDGSIGFYIG